MHTLHPLTSALLNHLAREEAVLRDALACGNDVFAALRRGDLPGALATGAKYEAAGVSLHDAAPPRAAAAAALARELGLSAQGVTLAALAAALPDPFAADLRAARARLTAGATELAAVQARNANLIGHLRSYFRGVLADLGTETPSRYGPTGVRVEPGAAGAVPGHS